MRQVSKARRTIIEDNAGDGRSRADLLRSRMGVGERQHWISVGYAEARSEVRSEGPARRAPRDRAIALTAPTATTTSTATIPSAPFKVPSKVLDWIMEGRERWNRKVERRHFSMPQKGVL